MITCINYTILSQQDEDVDTCPQQTQNISITFIQCWTNVEDVGPTLYKCYLNALCLLTRYMSGRVYENETSADIK